MRIKLNVFFILFLFAGYYWGRLAEMSVLFASVLVHELGHVLAARCMYIRVEEIELFPFGSVAKTEDITKYGGFVEAFIAAAGPAVSGVLALLLYLIPTEKDMVIQCAKYNTILCFFNLLPVLPMDGGRIFRNVLVYMISYKKATQVLVLWGRVLAILLLGWDIYILLHGSYDITAAVVAVFIYLGTIKEAKYCSYYYLLNSNSRKASLAQSKRIKRRVLKASPETYIRQLVNQFSPGNLCTVEVKDYSGNTITVLCEAEIMACFLKLGYDGRVRDILDMKK